MDYNYTLSIFDFFAYCLSAITCAKSSAIFNKMVGDIPLYITICWHFTDNDTDL